MRQRKGPLGHQGPAPNLAQLEGSSKKKNKTLRLAAKQCLGLLAAGRQDSSYILAATEVREGSVQLTFTGTINSRSPTS